MHLTGLWTIGTHARGKIYAALIIKPATLERKNLKVLFVCLGNTCRSPMAKVIFEQIVKQRELEGEIFADSAAKGYASLSYAKPEAREAIKRLYDADLLADHIPKSIRDLDLSARERYLNDFDLILTMDEDLKSSLPPEKTYTLNEYAGLPGEIDDPWGKDLDKYIRCRDEIRNCLEKAIERVLKERS